MNGTSHPVSFSVDYPDRELNRLTSFFRIFTVIPIAIVLGAVAGSGWQWTYHNGTTGTAAGAGGLLFLGPLLMILFRRTCIRPARTPFCSVSDPRRSGVAATPGWQATLSSGAFAAESRRCSS